MGTVSTKKKLYSIVSAAMHAGLTLPLSSRSYAAAYAERGSGYRYMDVLIIGSLDGSRIADVAQILQLAGLEPVRLTHHGAFTGKPQTRIHSDGKLVLKINQNRQFPSAEVAEQWCRLQLKKEIDFAIYHPQRTWLVLSVGGVYRTANLMPQMLPLHRFDFAGSKKEQRIQLLLQVLGCYLDFAGRYNLKLDDGLSNFAVCAEGGGGFCYLDDDIYPWDHFTSFSAMLGNWLRTSASLCLDEDDWRQLGASLKPLLRSHSSDAGDMVCESLKDQIVGRHEALKQSFLQALCARHAAAAIDQADAWPVAAEPIAVLADVHGNLPAFKAVLKALDARGIRQYLMLGDVVGYGPNPGACIDLVREREMYCLRGNHDHYVAHHGDVRVAMGIMARRVADWTISVLGEEECRWLGELPVRYRNQAWMAVHGAPVDKSFFNAYVYEMTSERNLDFLVEAGVKLCLHGHSHIQGVFARSCGRDMPFASPDRVDMNGVDAALVCPGSVGQSRGGRITARAAVFYPQDLSVEMLSLNYDIEPLIADMQRFGFSEDLIARTREGR